MFGFRRILTCDVIKKKHLYTAFLYALLVQGKKKKYSYNDSKCSANWYPRNKRINQIQSHNTENLHGFPKNWIRSWAADSLYLRRKRDKLKPEVYDRPLL